MLIVSVLQNCALFDPDVVALKDSTEIELHGVGLNIHKLNVSECRGFGPIRKIQQYEYVDTSCQKRINVSKVDYDKAKNFIIIRMERMTPIKKGRQYKIRIEYTVPLSDDMRGILVSKFHNEERENYASLFAGLANVNNTI